MGQATVNQTQQLGIMASFRNYVTDKEAIESGLRDYLEDSIVAVCGFIVPEAHPGDKTETSKSTPSTVNAPPPPPPLQMVWIILLSVSDLLLFYDKQLPPILL